MSLTIHEFDVKYRLAGIRQDAASVQARLNRLAREQLVRAWDRYVAGTELDESYCYIDHLDFAMNVDLASLDDGAIARRWVARLYDAIQRKIQSGGGVVFFTNRAHYLATFIMALLQGTDWTSDPCLREFLPYSTVDRGSAIVSVLTEEPDAGRDALLLLCQGRHVASLMPILTDDSAFRIWTRCLSSAGTSSAFTGSWPLWVRRILAYLSAHPLRQATQFQQLITLYLEILTEYPDLGPDANLAAFLQQWIQVVAEYSSRKPAANSAQARAGMGSGLPASGVFLQSVIAKVGEANTSALLQRMRATVLWPAAERTFSRVCGLFLLLPILEDWGFAEFLATLAARTSFGDQRTSPLRYLMGLQLLGHFRHGLEIDPGLFLFAGIDKAPEWTWLEKYAQSLSPEFYDSLVTWLDNRERLFQRGPGGADAISVHLPPRDVSFLPIDRVANSAAHLRALDVSLSAFTSVILHEFTRRIGSFAESSVDCLARNFFMLDGEIELSPDSLTLHLLTCPMGVLLRMTGMTSNERAISAFEGRVLRVKFPS